ncbi:class II aldolase/adducin family protein [Pelagibacterales bacterium SAG-MED31]|nr:class II aldolase/adducin family protein [Pelagibacterales bacterium SAG-MED31]
MKINNIFDDEELKNRIDLAAAYHLANIYGFSDIIWNHITCKTSSKKDTFLINRFGLMYDEVTASNLLEIDLQGNILNGEGDINYTGFVIHGAIHRSRKDINCVMHSHSRSGLAVSCLKNGLEILIQDSAMFHKKISYHDWQGMSTSAEECETISKDLGNNNTMILRNHGLLTAGKSISEAFMLMYYLDRACKVQLDLLSINKNIIKPSNNLLKFADSQYEDPKYKLGEHEWPALKRMLKKNNSIYDQ